MRLSTFFIAFIVISFISGVIFVILGGVLENYEFRIVGALAFAFAFSGFIGINAGIDLASN